MFPNRFGTIWKPVKYKEAPPIGGAFYMTQVYKPGSVLTAIYLAPQLLAGSSLLLEAVGPTFMLLHGVAPDRVYSTTMFP